MPTLHSITTLPIDVDSHRAFRLACQGGGTPPQWTEFGDDPTSWISPDDAAGMLVVALDERWRVTPSRFNADGDAVGNAMDVLDTLVDYAAFRAAYRSICDRWVFLARTMYSTNIIVVARPSDAPRLGASEDNNLREYPAAKVVLA